MPTTGSYKGHTFYASRAVPAEALAALLTPRVAPTPADLSQTMQGTRNRNAAMDVLRSAQMGSPNIEDMYAGVFPTGQTRDLTQPGEITRSVQGLTQDKGLASALATMLAPKRDVPPMPMNVSQSYAGQERGKSSSFSGDPLTPPAGRVVASIPTSSVSASDLVRGKSGISTIATFPTTGIGQPPATRVVTSVPVNRIDPVQSMPKFSELASMFGGSAPSVPGPAGYISNNKDPARLVPDVYFGGLNPNAGSPAPGAPKGTPATKAVTEQVVNPEWIRAQALLQDRPDPFLSRDAVAKRLAGIEAAKKIPQFIAQTRQVPVPAPQVPAPVARPTPDPAAPRKPAAAIASPVPAAPPAAKSLYYSDPVAFGSAAVAQSGDTSSANQLEAAERRAVGDAWRASRR